MPVPQNADAALITGGETLSAEKQPTAVDASIFAPSVPQVVPYAVYAAAQADEYDAARQSS